MTTVGTSLQQSRRLSPWRSIPLDTAHGSDPLFIKQEHIGHGLPLITATKIAVAVVLEWDGATGHCASMNGCCHVRAGPAFGGKGLRVTPEQGIAVRAHVHAPTLGPNGIA